MWAFHTVLLRNSHHSPLRYFYLLPPNEENEVQRRGSLAEGHLSDSPNPAHDSDTTEQPQGVVVTIFYPRTEGQRAEVA